MTKLDAMRALLRQPRDHADQSRIGRRVIHPKADGRERIIFTWKVLTSITKRRSA
jgi:hypothetical protein